MKKPIYPYPIRLNKFAETTWAKPLWLCCIAILIWLYPQQAEAQRNLFNVPTSEITEPGRLFFQQNLSYSNQLQSSTTFTYGLGKKLEVGLTVRDVTFNTGSGEQLINIDPNTPDENPDFLINAQKVFELTNWLNIGLGTRSGINAAHRKERVKYAGFHYLNSSFVSPSSDLKFIAGAYYANVIYAGTGTRAGLMLGTEIPLLKDKINFVGDMLTGNSDISRLTLGLGFSLPKQWQIALGGQLPMPNSGNSYAFVVQLSSP